MADGGEGAPAYVRKDPGGEWLVQSPAGWIGLES